MKSSSSPDSSRTSSSSADPPEFKVKPRHLEPRIFYTDYDVMSQRAMLQLARDTVKMVAERGVESETAFYHEVSKIVKDSLMSSEKEYSVIAGNRFGALSQAVKGSISFFAIGDVKFLVYRTK